MAYTCDGTPFREALGDHVVNRVIQNKTADLELMLFTAEGRDPHGIIFLVAL